jgi:hypothetical protein
MEAKYFVTIHAKDRAALLRLGAYSLDLLHQTALVTERRVVRLSAVKDKSKPNEFVESGPPHSERETSIDGLLTLKQIEMLVANGYQVLVREEARQRSRADQTMEFQDWLKAVSGK